MCGCCLPLGLQTFSLVCVVNCSIASISHEAFANHQMTNDSAIGGRTRGAGVAAAPLLGSIFLTGFLF
jgi:hypothetical protein